MSKQNFDSKIETIQTIPDAECKSIRITGEKHKLAGGRKKCPGKAKIERREAPQ